jgi:perosamine synthetase
MMLPRPAQPLPFPLNRPNTQHYYMGRNGLFALAQTWRLSGEEVLMPAYCHGVEAEAFERAGARLRFYPVHQGMQLKVDELLSFVSPRTKVIHLIHYLGFPGPVERLAEFCRKNDIRLVEDCALAFLSRLGDRPLGSFGSAANFSMYKSVPLPNGGAIAINDGSASVRNATHTPRLQSTIAYTFSALFRRSRLENVSTYARVMTAARNGLKPFFYMLGLERVATERFNRADASVGMSALSKRILHSQSFDRVFELRRRNFRHLLSRLGSIAGLVFNELPDGVCPLSFPIAVLRKNEVVQSLKKRGVEAIPFWSNHANGVNDGQFPEVDRLRRTVIELPCHQDLTESEMDRIADEVTSVLR